MASTPRPWFFHRGILVLVAIVAVAASAALFVRTPSATLGPIDERTKRLLEKTSIPLVEFNDITLLEAVDRLNALAGQYGLASDVHFAVWSGAKPPAGFHRLRAKYASAGGSLPHLIKFHLVNIPMSDLIHYTSGLADCAVGMRGHTVVFVSGFGEGTFGPIVTKKWRIDSTKIPNLGTTSARSWLESNGVQFRYEGTDAVWGPDHRTVIVTNTADDLDFVDADYFPATTWGERIKEFALGAATWLRSKF